MKEQEAKGLLSSLVVKTPSSKAFCFNLDYA